MNTKSILAMTVLGFVVITMTSAASIESVKELKGTNQHEMIMITSGLRTSWDQFWPKFNMFATAKDLQGLVKYLQELPETKMVLNWLKLNFPQVFQALCPLFDACFEGDDFVVSPEIIQKIMVLIARNDWDGLVSYLQSLEEFDLLCDWLKSQYPWVWAEICELLGKAC